ANIENTNDVRRLWRRKLVRSEPVRVSVHGYALPQVIFVGLELVVRLVRHPMPFQVQTPRCHECPTERALSLATLPNKGNSFEKGEAQHNCEHRNKNVPLRKARLA